MSTEIFKQNAIVTVKYRVYTTNTHNGNPVECDEYGNWHGDFSGFGGFMQEHEALSAFEEINRQYPPYNPDDADQEYQKYHNKNFVEKETYIVLLDDDGEEEDSICINQIIAKSK